MGKMVVLVQGNGEGKITFTIEKNGGGTGEGKRARGINGCW